MRRRPIVSAVLASIVALLSPADAPAKTGFSGWAAVVVAGDDQAAHENTPTEAFDNARRDVTKAFIARGFTPSNIVQFSLHPERYPADHADRASLERVWDRLSRLAPAAPDGCLVYITSHGSPDGVVMGDRLVPPTILAGLVYRACGARPTAVIVSACFSGVFVPALAAVSPRMFVMTAARRDRSSFGCGESNRYPFFDGCLIEDLPAARDFPDLADRVRRCVAGREDALGLRPRSHPQTRTSPGFAAVVPPFETALH